MLFCKAFGWKRTEDAASGYDAIDQQGTRYLIKARRITPTDPKRQSRQLSAIRNLDNLPFDFLAGLLVDENFQVIRAALVPVGVVWRLAIYVAYTNSWRFLLRDSVWTLPVLQDVKYAIVMPHGVDPPPCPQNAARPLKNRRITAMRLVH